LVDCVCSCHEGRRHAEDFNRGNPQSRWCENCFDDHVDFNKLMAQMDDCVHCGDGIPKKQMDEHIEWCKPMIERNKLNNLQLFDGDELVDINDIQRVTLICFKCTNYLMEKGGLIFDAPSESFSDNVDVVRKYHLCKSCTREVLKFCGAVHFD